MMPEGTTLGRSEPVIMAGPVDSLKFPTLGTRWLCEQERNAETQQQRSLSVGEFNHRIVGHFCNKEWRIWVN